MHTDRQTYTHTPDVDPEEVVEIKHVVATDPHPSVRYNNILE